MKKTCFLASLLMLGLFANTLNAADRKKPQATEPAVQEENPIATIKQTPGMTAIFRNWGFIGDSLCSGEMECWEKGRERVTYKDMYEYSWGQQLCRLCGAEGYNYSYGGQTAKGWIEKESARTWAGAKLTPRQAYIIAMGVNDHNPKQNIVKGDVATDIDTLDYNKNAQTFAGYYAGIIQRVHSVSPGAKIFLVTRPRSNSETEDEYDQWNEVIRGIAKMFKNVYLIDLYKYAPAYDKSFKAEHYLNGHLSAEGYLYTAYMFMTYIDWIVRNNPDEFKDVPLIGTSYKTKKWQ